MKKQANKQISKRTSEHIDKIRKYFKSVDEAASNDIASAIGFSPARTRAILSEMTDEIKAVGATNRRRYRKKVAKHNTILDEAVVWLYIIYKFGN